jgi:hypothetical protein
MRLAQDEAPEQETPAGTDVVFRLAAAGFHAARETLAELRDDIVFEDAPAPRRIAPYAAALGATAYRGGQASAGQGSADHGNAGHGNAGQGSADEDEEIGTGRLVLLYDPDGQPGWTGVFRLVAFVRAEIEEEIAADPLLGEVGWSWLTDALETHAPGYTAPSGTVTRVITEGFGAKSDEPPRTEFELRASWSPPEDTDLGANVAAWFDLLAAAAGLPAQPPGTTALRPGGRRQR